MAPKEEQFIQQPDHPWLKWAGGAVVLGAAAAGVLTVGDAHPAAAYERTPTGVTVEQGDNSWDIVHQVTGTNGEALVHNVQTFAKANHLSNPGRIMPGQHLSIDAIEPSHNNHAPSGDSYTLKYHDTIWDVVKAHYGYVSASLVKEVAQRSDINMDEYYPGQVVRFVEPAKPASPAADNHHGLRHSQPEKAQEIPKATVTITSRDQTVWALSSIVAAITNTSHEAAEQSIMTANPGLIPEQIQSGDKVVLPGVSDKTLQDVMNAIKFMAAYQAEPQGSVLMPSDNNLAIEAAQQPSDSKALAKDIVTNSNITIQSSPNERVAKSLLQVASGGLTFSHDVNQPNTVKVSPRLLQVVQGLAEHQHVTITSLTTGDHVANSDHYKGEAVDIQGDPNIFKELYNNRQELGLDELIWATPPPGTTTLDNGQPAQYNSETINEHRDHIHISVNSQDPLPAPTTPIEQAPVPVPEAPTTPEATSSAPFTIESNMDAKTNYSVEQLNKVLEGTAMAGLGQNFHDLEVKYDIPSIYAIAAARMESTGGTSPIAIATNNLFGMGAFDSCPMSCADRFQSFAQSIDAFGAHIRFDYLSPGGKWYRGTTLHNIYENYSTSHDEEAVPIAEIMNELAQKANG